MGGYFSSEEEETETNEQERDEEENDEIRIELLLIGTLGVGKTSLMFRFAGDPFPEFSPLAIFYEFKILHKSLGGKNCKIRIWDNFRFSEIKIPGYRFRGKHGVLMVYNVSNRKSFEDIKRYWNREVETGVVNPDIPKFIIGNQIDLPRDGDEREVHQEVTTSEGQSLADEIHATFFEVSARTGEGVEKSLEEIVLQILQSRVPIIKGVKRV